MKRLIILSLLVPMLCFADEVEPMSLEDEVAMKIAQMHRVQNAVETARAGVEASAQVEEVVETEFSMAERIWAVGALIFLVLGAAISIGIFVMMGWRCIRFNYHYYIEYGDYRLGWELESGERTKIQFILNKLGCESTTDDTGTDYMDTSWFGFLAMWFVATLVIIIGAILWPLTVIVLGPNLLTELVANGPRKKKIFEKKLKGEMTNGSV